MAPAHPEPDFSIIIPARNMEHFIEETLESVRSQSAPSFEVICVDDGSSDKTPEIAESFAKIDKRFRVLRGRSEGVSAARNLGLSQARGQLVLFLDADDLLHSNALHVFFASMSNSTSIGALSGVQKIDIKGRQLRGSDNRSLVPKRDHLTELLKKNFVVNGGALALRTQEVRLCGGYDEDLVFGEDWEFWCRMALKGSFHVIEGPALLFYRQVASGANFTKPDPLFARRPQCIQKIAANPSMQEKFGRRLHYLLRARQIDLFWSGVRNQYQYGRKSVALLEGLVGIFIFPDSIFRPKLIWRFAWSLKRHGE